jgi:hypothetical protein
MLDPPPCCSGAAARAWCRRLRPGAAAPACCFCVPPRPGGPAHSLARGQRCRCHRAWVVAARRDGRQDVWRRRHSRHSGGERLRCLGGEAPQGLTPASRLGARSARSSEQRARVCRFKCSGFCCRAASGSGEGAGCRKRSLWTFAAPS